MRRIPPSAQLFALLNEYDAAGGVVSYTVMELDVQDELSVEHHRETVLAAVADALLRDTTELLPDADVEKFATTTPTRISGKDFMGPLWAPTRGVLITHGYDPQFLNSFFYANGIETRETVLDHIQGLENKGYAYTFSEPPHRLRCSRMRASELFSRINDLLFGYDLLATSVMIYEWDTTWSSYFDAGHEWWGAFLWTVWVPGRRIVGITASTTD